MGDTKPTIESWGVPIGGRIEKIVQSILFEALSGKSSQRGDKEETAYKLLKILEARPPNFEEKRKRK